MATIVTRAGKGSPLTNTEVDANFTNLNTAKVEVVGTPTNTQVIQWNSSTSQWVPGTVSGTVTSVAALTLGTTGTDLSSSVATGTTTPVITLNVPTASAVNRGALSSTDWSTFNGKQASLVSGTNIKTVNGTSLLGSGDVGTISVSYGGTGATSLTSGYLVKGNGTSAASASIIYDSGSNIGINATLPGATGFTSFLALGNNNAGIGNLAANIIGVATNNTERMRIDASGNVGIGTSSPGAKLDIAGTLLTSSTIATADGIGLKWGGLSGTVFLLGNSSANYLSAWTNSAERLRIDTSGNVGIGTTSPGGKLDVSGTNGNVQINAAGDQIAYTYNGYNYITASGAAATLQMQATGAGGTLTFATNGSERARINSAGNFLVGSTAADYGSNFNFRKDQNAATTLLVLNNSTGVSVTSRIAQITGTGFSYVNNSLNDNSGSPYYSYDFGSAVTYAAWTFGGSERFRISSTGAITSSNLADAVGYKGLPQNSQTASYTLALADIGKHISITTGGVVIPANGSVAFPVGATIVIFNNSGSTQALTITTDTLRQAGTTNTGARTIAVYGLVTCVKVASTTWVVTGNVT